jgi:hypothetical protein
MMVDFGTKVSRKSLWDQFDKSQHDIQSLGKDQVDNLRTQLRRQSVKLQQVVELSHPMQRSMDSSDNDLFRKII